MRLAATAALGKIKSPEAIQGLAVALEDRDPAMQYVAVEWMKSVTGKDYGPNVEAWRQVAAGGTPPPETRPRLPSAFAACRRSNNACLTAVRGAS